MTSEVTTDIQSCPAEEQDVFWGILHVLQRIETKLETHETRVRQIEDIIHRNRSAYATSQDFASSSSKDSSHTLWRPQFDNAPVLPTRNLNPPSNGSVEIKSYGNPEGEAFSTYSRGGPKLRYSVWRSDQTNDNPTDMLDESHLGLLGKYLGQCSIIPDDSRLPLNFSWTVGATNRAAPGIPKLVDNLAETQRLDALRTFDADLKSQPGNDFLVVDFDTSNNSRLYRVGQDAIGAELMVSSESRREAPWSRLM
ncbi:MAG: hypothetical protein Q9182_007502 [Xanthomendoza sp. 2 TL-2023]